MFVEFTEIERFNFNCIHSIVRHGTAATKENKFQSVGILLDAGCMCSRAISRCFSR